ncbi:hypothetical protein [Nocardiopsis valliformis]|uniref:hypothetical protein n=1 Tax=Nocardiopsis valliformis TaxID=239974 RepID=UPI00034A2E9C|nr:hypothetical protein [Nocardiopsis valliformis]
MTISPGFTTAEIREFVHEYQLQPYGHKGSWLATQGISYKRMRRWSDAVFEGDLDRGLIPRESSAMNVPPNQRTALERKREKERTTQAAEIARLAARVKELEETNTALGKAIGLLHTMREQEPAEPPKKTDPTDS